MNSPTWPLCGVGLLPDGKEKLEPVSICHNELNHNHLESTERGSLNIIEHDSQAAKHSTLSKA